MERNLWGSGFYLRILVETSGTIWLPQFMGESDANRREIVES
jgi:hypothetical protein